MTYVVTINAPIPDHLAMVMEEMKILGAPKIRAIADDRAGVIVALEGSHRLAAAQALGLSPIFVMLDENEMIKCQDIGYDDCGWFEGNPARAVDIRDRLAGEGSYRDCHIISIDQNELRSI
jgi:hypothetical protein